MSVLAAAVILPSSLIAAAVSVGFAALIIAYSMIRFRGRTWRQWRQLARHRKTTTRTDAFLFSTRRNAVTWDGNRLSMFLELTPPAFQPLTLTMVNGKMTGVPEVPLDVIADSLRQYDIVIDHVAVTSHGYVSASTEPYDVVYAATSSLGQLSRFRTIIKVSVRLATSMNSVDARRGDGDGPEVGLARTTYVSTQRLMRSLIDEGWGARPLSMKEVEAIDAEFSESFGDAFEQERRTEMGSEVLTRVYSSRTVDVDVDAISPSAATVTVCRVLSPQRHGRVHIDTLVAVTGQDREDVAVGKGLSAEAGVQGDLLSQMLPLAPYVDTLRTNTAVFLNKDEVEPAGQAYGTGVALGELRDNPKMKAFLSLAGARGSVLHVYVGGTHIRTLIMRMAAAGERVCVDLPDEDGQWEAWVRAVGSERIFTKSRDPEGSLSTVQFVDGSSNVESSASKITVAVCVSPPPRSARFTLTVGDEANLYALSTPEEVVVYYATADDREWPWLRGRS